MERWNIPNPSRQLICRIRLPSDFPTGCRQAHVVKVHPLSSTSMAVVNITSELVEVGRSRAAHVSTLETVGAYRAEGQMRMYICTYSGTAPEEKQFHIRFLRRNGQEMLSRFCAPHVSTISGDVMVLTKVIPELHAPTRAKRSYL